MSRLPRALARLILSALLACLPASFAARAQGADDRSGLSGRAAHRKRRCARVARLSPAVQAQNKQVAQAILAGDWPVAERLGADMARLDPANADIRHFQGRLLALQKRYAPAIEKFDEAIALDAGNRWFWSARPARRRMPAIWRAPCAARRPCANAFPTGASATTCGPLCWTAWTARPKRWPRMSAPSPRTPPARRYGSTRACCCAGWAAADARDAFDAALRLQPDYARAQAELDSLPAR